MAELFACLVTLFIFFLIIYYGIKLIKALIDYLNRH